MANTSVVYARIDTELKTEAESILSTLGISPSSAVQMLYSQVVLQKGLPFELRLPPGQPTAIDGMTQEQLNAEVMRGIDALQSGKTYSADEVDVILARKYGI